MHVGLTSTAAAAIVLLNVLRCRLTYYGQAETNAEAWFSMVYVHGNQKAH